MQLDENGGVVNLEPQHYLKMFILHLMGTVRQESKIFLEHYQKNEDPKVCALLQDFREDMREVLMSRSEIKNPKGTILTGFQAPDSPMRFHYHYVPK